MVEAVVFILLGSLALLIVILIKKLKTPKNAMKKVENAGDLRGKSYSELCRVFGKPSSVSTESDKTKVVCWYMSNGFASTHYLSKSTVVHALFDPNNICIDYSYESNR